MEIKSALQEGINTLRLQLKSQISKMSQRERVLVAVCSLALVISVVYMIYKPLNEAFVKQSDRLVATLQQLQNVSAALARYQKLQFRRDEVEREFREVQIEEGALSYLEELVKTKAGVINPQISPRDIREFGSDYEQTPFSIRFPIVDLSRLVDFLETLVHGPKPFILASLDLRRRPAGDSLDVELEVSSIRKKK